MKVDTGQPQDAVQELFGAETILSHSGQRERLEVKHGDKPFGCPERDKGLSHTGNTMRERHLVINIRSEANTTGNHGETVRTSWIGGEMRPTVHQRSTSRTTGSPGGIMTTIWAAETKRLRKEAVTVIYSKKSYLQ